MGRVVRVFRSWEFGSSMPPVHLDCQICEQEETVRNWVEPRSRKEGRQSRCGRPNTSHRQWCTSERPRRAQPVTEVQVPEWKKQIQPLFMLQTIFRVS